MHENLKMRVNFQSENNTDGTPRMPITNEYQSICGRLDHGTFYMVYIKLHKHEIINVAGDISHKYTVSFFLQNYDGAITMGLDPYQKVRLVENSKKTKENDYHYQIKLKVEPFNSNTALPQQEAWVIDGDSKNPNKSPLHDCIIDVEIDMQLAPSTLYNHNDLESSQYIDPMLWERDGENYLRRSYRLHKPGDPSTDTIEDLERTFGEDLINLLAAYDSEQNTNFVDQLRDKKKEGYGRPFTTVCYPRRFQIL